MKKRPILVWVVTFVTLASGLTSIYSIVHPNLAEHRALVAEGFFLQFRHLSRLLTLFIGFFLVTSSLNIYKRKRRAFQSVVVLASFSVVLHLTKGHDYLHALFPVALLVTLLLAHRSFAVKSSIPNLRSGILRFGMAAVLGLGYGVIGFWLLDPREFGIDFTLGDSLRRTVLFFSLVGDPQIAPHTRHAHWFVDSLYLMTATTIGYSLLSLFRPAIYRLRTLPHERLEATAIVEKHGRSSLDYFKTWPDKSLFFSSTGRSFVAYAVGGRFAVALGDPVGPEEEIEAVIREYAEFCAENDWAAAFHQTLPDFLPVYRSLGFRKLKVGDDAIVDLTKFPPAGKASKDFRSTVNQAEKAGLRIVSFDPPIADDVLRQVREVSDEWLRLPGRRERRFTLGLFQPDYVRSTPLVTAADRDGRIQAFVNIIPTYPKGDSTIDLMRRRTDAPHGVMDYLFIKLFSDLQEKGYRRFNMGMAPMSGFQEREEASPEERAVHTFFQHLNFLFSYRGLRQYKAKFATSWEPRYSIYRNPLDLALLGLALGKVSEVKD